VQSALEMRGAVFEVSDFQAFSGVRQFPSKE
jgi:hypothetical protein